MDTTRRALAAAIAASPFGLLAQGREGDWPSRPVTIIVGFPTGQTTDIVARTLAEELAKSLGQPFVVDNRPGAGSTIGAAAVARAKPDGYTVLMGASGNMAVAPHLYQNLQYDSLKDFDHVAMTGIAPLVLLVRPDSRHKTLSGIVEAARRGEKVTCASGGNGVVNHLALEVLKKATGAPILHVPYRGSAPALTDLLGGQVDCLFETLPPSLPHIRSGKLVPLAASSATRIPLLPEVPTVAETYSAFGAVVPWTLVSVPAGTPKPIVAKLSSEVFDALKRPHVKSKLESLGNFVDPAMDEDKTKAWVVSEHAKFGRIIKDGNIRLEQ
jgi:tripartite-type tricarboxylate transporter receptor subunit TctC